MRWMVGLLVAAAFLACGDGGNGSRKKGGAGEPVSPKAATESAAYPLPEMPAVPEGAGRITGIVRETDGAPLVGVVMIAEPDPPHWNQQQEKAPEPPVERELDSLLREWEADERWRRAAQRRVTTDVDGKFVIAKLGEVDYAVSAYKLGYQCASPLAFRARPGASLVFTATPIVRLPVEIVGFDGFVRIQHEMLEGDSAGSRGSSQVYPEHRWIELPPGRYALQAETDVGDLRRESAKTIVLLEAGATHAPARFELAAQAALRLRVTRPEEFAAAEFAARVQRIGKHGGALGESKGPDTHSHKTGQLVWRQLVPGRYRVSIGWWILQDPMPGSPLEAQFEEELLVAVGVHDHAARLEAPDLSKLFVVRVLDPAGELLTGVKFGLHWQKTGGSGSHSIRQEAVRGRSGLSYLAPMESTVDGGTFTIDARHGRFGIVASPAKITDTGPLELRYGEPARLTVAVAGVQDADLRARLLVALERSGNVERPYGREGNVGKQSRATLQPWQPGASEVVLYIRATDANRRWEQLVRQKIELKAGVREIRLWLPPLHSLRVVRKGAVKAEVALRRVDADDEFDVLHRRRHTDNDGVAIFRDLPGGRYRVFSSGASLSGDENEIVVPAQRSVTLTPGDD